jgi:RNA polymerase sigma-70 factor (ECF subfamily)
MAEEPLPRKAGAAPPPPASEALSADSQLVSAVLRNDRKATAQLVSQHADAVHGYVRHRLAPRTDLVDDVVQDVFLAAFEHLGQFRGTSSLRSWMLGIARHKVEDFYRRQLRIPDPLDAEEHEPAVDEPLAEEVIDRERARARAYAVLQQLPDPYAYLLLWRYWENRSVRDIAQAIGKTEKAIERTLARARARFKQLWEQKLP